MQIVQQKTRPMGSAKRISMGKRATPPFAIRMLAWVVFEVVFEVVAGACRGGRQAQQSVGG